MILGNSNLLAFVVGGVSTGGVVLFRGSLDNFWRVNTGALMEN